MRGIHVSAHTPLGVPSSGPAQSDSGSGGEDEPGTPRISFRRSRSVHGPMLKLSVVAEIANRHKKTPEQVLHPWVGCNSMPIMYLMFAGLRNLNVSADVTVIILNAAW